MDWADDSDGDATACGKLVDSLRRLNDDLEVPSPSQQGHDRGEWFARMPLMAEQALASGSPQNNPRIPTAGEIVALYKKVW